MLIFLATIVNLISTFLLAKYIIYKIEKKNSSLRLFKEANLYAFLSLTISLFAIYFSYYKLVIILIPYLIFVIFKIFKNKINPNVIYENTFYILSFLATFVSSCFVITIFLSLLGQTIKFFELESFRELFSLIWEPQENNFGLLPLFSGTLLISFIALAFSVPIGIFTAIYLFAYVDSNKRIFFKPTLEILAGIPTVVYGYFAAIHLGPFIAHLGSLLNLNISSESALSAGITLGIMILPIMISMTEDYLNTLPKTFKNASLALGSTESEAIIHILLPASLPGILSAILISLSRAIGETMIVTMAAGLKANLTLNPFNSVTTITAQIVTLLTGDQEFDNSKTLAAFMLAFALFLITLTLNTYAAKLLVEKNHDH